MPIRSPADIVNLALVRIGSKERVGSLYDGSMAAIVALEIYGQTRDELLRQNDWKFASTDVTLTLLKSAPPDGYMLGWDPSVNPPIPWLFEYGYPADAIEMRSIKQQTLFFPDYDPKPIVWSIDSDSASKQKVILCNVPNAIGIYTRRITDPTLWENDFIEALSAALGRRMAPLLSSLDAAKMEVADEGQSAAVAAAQEN